MTTNFEKKKYKLYCHGIPREKQRLGQFSLKFSDNNFREKKNPNFIFMEFPKKNSIWTNFPSIAPPP